MKKEEGKAFDLNTEETTQKVLEVGTSTNETKIDDKTSFENFKVLYDGRIKEKCLADYGTIEDKELLEDTAKELYLTSQELIPDEDTKSEGDLEEEKTKQEENVKLTERTFKSGRTKTEAISNESKFLAHILNGVISDVQNKFNVTATGELDTGNKNKVVVTLKGSTLDLIDATSYLAKAIRRDDVDFTFDDEIKNNTVRCVISPKTKTESKDNEDSEYNYMLLSRLKSDCDYFLGNGNRYEKHLWAGNVDDQIAKMKELYNKLPEKPEWLTMEDIENYEKEMKQDKKMESKFDKSQAVLSLDNYHSMGIIVSDDGSTVQYMYSNDEDSVYESDIEYDEEGRPYFKDEEGETWYIDEFMKTTFSESKEVKKESRDRVAENLPKFVYDLTKSDFDKYGETAWSADGPMKNADGKTIYEVYRNGKSDFKIADVVAEIQKEFPELKLSLQSTAPGDRVFFVKETKKQESQSTEVGYNEFTEDMEEIERTINFIKEPKNKDAKEVLDDIKEFLNKLWADKEQNTFGIKYAESKQLLEDEDKELIKQYSDRVKSNITDKGRENFEELKEILEDGEDKEEQEGFYFAGKALQILNTADRNHNLNSYMNLTKSDILNMISDNDTIEEVVDSLFVDYKPDSALAWADNFVTIMNNLDTNIDVEELEEGKEDDVFAQIMSEEQDSVEGYRDTIMEMGLSKEDFIDMITTENEHKLMNEKGLTKEQEAEVYGKLYDTMI